MKKFLNGFFVVLGVVFFLVLIALAYIYFTNTFGIKSLLKGNPDSSSTPENVSTDSSDKNPLIPDAQEKALEDIGIDTSTLPTEITPEMLACFDAKLGTARTEEIKNGSPLTAGDYAKAGNCI